MQKYVGSATSGGLSVGKIKIVNRRITGFKRVVLATHREKSLFASAITLAKDELQQLIDISDDKHKDILNFQVVMLDDVGLNDLITQHIHAGVGAASAVELAMEEYCQKIRGINDEYLSARSSDVRDALMRVVDILDSKNRERFYLSEPTIIIADEILPSDLAMIDRNFALGFVTVCGSYQSHANIIARTMGIPSVCNVDSEILNPLFEGKTVAIDGYTGEVFLSPAESTLALFKHKMNLEKRNSLSTACIKDTKIIHPSGQEILIFANCNDPQDISLAINNGASGIGLVRSEILFMSKDYNTSVASQIEFYSKCITASQGKPISVRTYDVGADKPIDKALAEKEPNPALGVRGVRLLTRHRQLFADQIEALFIASDKAGKVNVMIPMVSVEKDITEYMQLVNEIKNRLLSENKIVKDNLTWGIMIETPAAALISEQLSSYVSFFSIGTNDLTQYTLAADRINTDVAVYYDPVHPAVLKLIDMTVQSAKKSGIHVSICGESAADFECAKLYIDLGIRCLSMAQNAMIPIKQHLIDIYAPSKQI